jgi:hypothetical protein
MLPTIQAFADAAHDGLQELHSGDRVAIIVFDAKDRVVLPFTRDLGAVERTLKNDMLNLSSSGQTTALAAASKAAGFLLGQSNDDRRRSVLHVFSMGVGIFEGSEEKRTERYWEADTVYNAMVVHALFGQGIGGLSSLSPALTILKNTLTATVEDTGGELFSARDARFFRDALHYIRCRYSLWYERPMRGRFGRQATIAVELAKDTKKRYPKSKVHARSGYLLQR